MCQVQVAGQDTTSGSDQHPGGSSSESAGAVDQCLMTTEYVWFQHLDLDISRSSSTITHKNFELPGLPAVHVALTS